MDVNAEVDNIAPNVNECEANSDRDVENLGAVSGTLFVKDKEVRAIDEQQAVTVNDVIIVEEAVTPAAVKELVVNDDVVFQVAENAREIRQFVATECTTDGVVTYVTVAPSSTRETVSTGYVEQMPCEKEQVEILQETYENITQGNVMVQDDTVLVQENNMFVQDNVMVHEDNLLVQEDSVMIQEDNVIVQEDNDMVQEDNVMAQEDNVMVQEDNVMVQDDNGMEQGDNMMVQEDNVTVQEDNYELPRQSYEKFVQDAIKGEMEEPIMLITETTESETIKQEKIHEMGESIKDDQGVNKSTDSIEAKLQELTEGHEKLQHLQHLEGGKEECKSVSIKMNDTDTGNESSVDDRMVLVSENEEIITADFVGVDDQIEQGTIEEPEVSVPDTIVINKPPSPQDNIEKQLSKIVHDDEPHQLSIAEEISRDFDDSDSDELTVSQQESHDDVIEEVVNIAKQLGHGPVTVTDTTGQVYYVESVEEVIVVENDPKIIDRKEVQEEVVEEERPAPPPIPSHLLGRNIDNPIEDTFRNGKTPPKPRLGVKIPYKHLTSQIVSKEDITKELLERSKSKVLQSRTSREQYFTNKLTRRLAKKIAPNTHQKRDKVLQKDKEINNSDLIAILEGKDEDKHVEGKTQSDEKIVHMDKELERELALKQLSELPRRGRRRKSSGYDIIENVNIPPRVRRSDMKSESREDGSMQKANNPKVIVEQSNRNLVVESANIEHCSVEVQQQTEVDQTHIDAKKLSTEIKKTYADIKKPYVEVKKPYMEVTKQNVQMENANLELEKLNHETTKAGIAMKEIKIERREPTVEDENPIGDEEKSEIDSPPLKESEPKVMVETSKVTIQKIQEKTKADQKESSEVSSKLSEEVEKKSVNLPIKTYERKRKSTDESITPIPEKKPVIKSAPSNAYVTKSSRIIKKKIIWDPDDPTTAKFAADKISPQRIIKGAPLVKVIVRETRRSELPSTQIKSIAKPEKSDKIVSKLEKIVSKPKLDSGDKDTKSKSPETTNRTKKRLSEVDKLLMDEGAVNLLYSVKNEDTRRFTGTTISLDKIQKELMNKTNEIKRELTSSTDKISPKSLRKKESPAATPTKKPYPASISRKKSKDSNRSSIHSPPASPSPMIYANHADASRIIRRHSSSSYSSTEGDEVNEEHKDERKPPKKRLKQDIDGQGNVDKQKINDENFSKLDEENKSNNYNFDYSKFEQYTAIKVGQLDNLVQASLLCEESEKAYLTYEVLLELTDLLKELQIDDSCKVVVLSSTAPSFCHGINYKSLHIEDEQIKKEIAQKLAKAVTEYLKTLANFPKIIIAGVQGECIGLAVTMLPLFDMVLASDTASFSIPNAKLGCAAEGGSLLSLPHLMHNALVSEMLYASRKFVAAEALRFGMVTRVIWPDKFQTELVAAVKEISTHSLQFKQITKRQLRNRMKHQIEESLAGEEEVLLETWISAECQKNFETYD